MTKSPKKIGAIRGYGAIRTLQSLEEAKELQIRGGKGRWQVLPPTPRTRTELE